MKTSVDIKKCGNCQYWTGSREPVFNERGEPKVEIHDKCGECENEISKFCNQKRKKEQSCKNFSKWTELF